MKTGKQLEPVSPMEGKLRYAKNQLLRSIILVQILKKTDFLARPSLYLERLLVAFERAEHVPVLGGLQELRLRLRLPVRVGRFQEHAFARV